MSGLSSKAINSLGNRCTYQATLTIGPAIVIITCLMIAVDKPVEMVKKKVNIARKVELLARKVELL